MTASGDPILAVYDNPGTTLPFMRRNEIHLPVAWSTEDKLLSAPLTTIMLPAIALLFGLLLGLGTTNGCLGDLPDQEARC